MTTKWPTTVAPDLWAELALQDSQQDFNRAIMGEPVPDNNHEVWKVCANCGQHFDARWGWYCPDCNFDNEP